MVTVQILSVVLQQCFEAVRVMELKVAGWRWWTSQQVWPSRQYWTFKMGSPQYFLRLSLSFNFFLIFFKYFFLAILIGVLKLNQDCFSCTSLCSVIGPENLQPITCKLKSTLNIFIFLYFRHLTSSFWALCNIFL